MSILWRGNNMNSSNKKRNLKPKNLKDSEIPGQNCTPKAKSMSAIAKLMATFYGIDQN